MAQGRAEGSGDGKQVRRSKLRREPQPGWQGQRDGSSIFLLLDLIRQGQTGLVPDYREGKISRTGGWGGEVDSSPVGPEK